MQTKEFDFNDPVQVDDAVSAFKAAFGHEHARSDNPDTSKKAAHSAAGFALTHAGIIYQALLEIGPMIPDEIARHLGWYPMAVHRRMKDLERLGKARTTGETRLSDGRRESRVWEAIRD
jgi:hypothetical protein